MESYNRQKMLRIWIFFGPRDAQVYQTWNISNHFTISVAFVFGWVCFSAALGRTRKQTAGRYSDEMSPGWQAETFTIVKQDSRIFGARLARVSIFLRLQNGRISQLLIWWPFPTSAVWQCHPVRGTRALSVCDERWSQGSNEGRSYRHCFFCVFFYPPDGGFLTTRVSGCLKVMCLPLPLSRSAECLSAQFPRGPRGRMRQCESLMWFSV